MPNRTLTSKDKIADMTKGGAILAHIRNQVAQAIRPGVSSRQLDELAENLIGKFGGEPSFKMVEGYNFATCININEGVVHGIPKDIKINKGDLVTVDIGIIYQGFHTDTATTLVAGATNKKNLYFLKAGKKALKNAIQAAKVGNRVEDISREIQKTIEKSGFSCISSLTGHGIGKNLHEEPPIPCVIIKEKGKSPKLEKGQTLAIEVIYAQGSPQLNLEDDGWTLITSDGKNTAVFEETVLVTAKVPVILTKEG